MTRSDSTLSITVTVSTGRDGGDTVAVLAAFARASAFP